MHFPKVRARVRIHQGQQTLELPPQARACSAPTTAWTAGLQGQQSSQRPSPTPQHRPARGVHLPPQVQDGSCRHPEHPTRPLHARRQDGLVREDSRLQHRVLQGHVRLLPQEQQHAGGPAQLDRTRRQPELGVGLQPACQAPHATQARPRRCPPPGTTSTSKGQRPQQPKGGQLWRKTAPTSPGNSERRPRLGKHANH